MNFFMAWECRAPFPTPTVEVIRRIGAIPEINWEPRDPKHGSVQEAYRLDDLVAYDEYVDGFAQGCAA